MYKTYLSLLFISTLSANTLEINLQMKNQSSNDFIFLERLGDGGKEELSTTNSNSNIRIHSNFNELIGFNYDKHISGIDYDNKELYIGTDSMKYIAFSKISTNIDYGSRQIDKSINKLTFLNIFEIQKITQKSSKLEMLDEKTATNLNDDDTDFKNPILINRNLKLEFFKVSSESIYDMVKSDLKDGIQYLNPFMFSKKLDSNFNFYGVTILALSHYNYTSIHNTYTDTTGKVKNIIHKVDTTEVDSNGYAILKDDLMTADTFITGKYTGWEYGIKATIDYEIENFSAYATLNIKKVDMKNKFGYDEVHIQTQAIYYPSFSYLKKDILLGFKYSF